MNLVTDAEVDEALSLLDPGFPFFAALRMADSVHLHVKVDDVDALPASRIEALGTEPENARPGYVKVPVSRRHQSHLLVHSHSRRGPAIRSAASQAVRRSLRDRPSPGDGYRPGAL